MKHRGFTLIELLVVVAIIALLISILLPSLARAKDQTRDAVCRSNMRQVTLGFLMYASEWRDHLPGGFHDSYRNTNGELVVLDWLGTTILEPGPSRWSKTPDEGSIFRYVRNRQVYLCPAHRLRHESDTSSSYGLEHITSYTAPKILTGAPIPLLKTATYPRAPLRTDAIPRKMHLTETMMAPIIVEEDTNWYLVRSVDSAWCNVDQITDRHRKAGAVGFVDGHVELRKFPKKPAEFSSFNLIYDLADGRRISAWRMDESPQLGGIYFGYLHRAYSDNIR